VFSFCVDYVCVLFCVCVFLILYGCVSCVFVLSGIVPVIVCVVFSFVSCCVLFVFVFVWYHCL